MNTFRLNFRSPDCFEIGWPMRQDHDFFCINPSKNVKKKKSRTSSKTQEDEKSDNIEDEEMGVSKLLNIYIMLLNKSRLADKHCHLFSICLLFSTAQS